MGRMSTKANKNAYQRTREELGLTREKASILLESIMSERIEKIENEKTTPHPEEVMIMADKYRQPSLRNYYCANQCPIGKKYVPEIQPKELSAIVLETLASLQHMNKKKERLIEIAADGTIDPNEIQDFIQIQNHLEQISMTTKALQLWCEKMLADGIIDADIYHQLKNPSNR